MRLPIFLCCLFALTAARGADWSPVAVPAADPIAEMAPLWLRCFLRVPDTMVTPAPNDLWRDSMTLSVGGIPGPFSIHLNGQKIATGNALPEGQRQRFKVPKGIFEKTVFNVLAIRLENQPAAPRVALAPILAGYFDEIDLRGTWQAFSGEPDPAGLKPVREPPKGVTSFIEAAFHPSASPLAPNPAPIPGARLAPEASLATMTTPADLAVELVLHEPEVAQPTHLSFDERGRLWVAQYRQYPYPGGLKMISRDRFYRARYDHLPPAPPGHHRGADIISVHEDTDGDGIFDKHRNVIEGLNLANAALHGHGGVWVMQTPYLLFYPDANGDDVPDGDPEVRLAGFGLEDTHSVSNGLVWGPDGWLYGCQGSTVASRVTRPGIDPPDFPGVYFEGCMVWRYHPRTKAYEIFAEGGGNVFSLEFDAEGRLFSGHNGGDTRGWHYVAQGLYLKQGYDLGKYGPPANPFAFGHLDAMKSRHPIQRFTHAIVVAEGTALPAHYLGRFFGADPLHRNVVIAERYRRGSTFETSDSAVAVAASDPAFRPVYLTNAPDGSIYVADFYEEFIAHGQNYQGQIDPSTGRIFRLRGKENALRKDVNLGGKTTVQLVELLAHPNRWHRQTAVRLLGERRDPAAREPLQHLLDDPAVHPALEALWALHQRQEVDEAVAKKALAHPAAAVRGASVQLLAEGRRIPEALVPAVLRLASNEPEAEVRSQLAASARRLPAAQALPLTAALLRRAEDATDPFIPLLCWWAIEAHCATDREAVLGSIAWDAPLKEQILPRLMRRFATTGVRADLLICARLLEIAPAAEHQKLLMTGFEEAFQGRALPPLPEELVTALSRSGLASRHLRVRSREPAAVGEALKVIHEAGSKLEERLLCARLFGEVKVPESVPVLIAVAKSDGPTELRRVALTSLLLYDDAAIGREIVALYPQLPAEVQPAAQNLLTSRAPWALAFLQLIERGQVSREVVPPDIALRLRSEADLAVATLAKKVFAPAPTATNEQHRATIERLRGVIAAGPGDPYKGEPIFTQRCASCHYLFHKGGRLGPDLTTYQRDDLSTLLTSIINPNAEIREGFRNHIVTTKDGRTISGLLTDQDDAVVVVRGFGGQEVSISRAEVRELRAAEQSLMPEGLLQGLNDQEVRDFFAYLRISQPFNK